MGILQPTMNASLKSPLDVCFASAQLAHHKRFSIVIETKS